MGQENSFNDDVLAGQINDFNEEISFPKVNTPKEEPVESQPTASSFIGTQLQHKVGGYGETDKEETKRIVEENKLSRIGDKIQTTMDIRDGWMEVDRALFGERSKFYPPEWHFRIRPATVEAIRNWSTIDEENPLSIDEVLNEILKSCFSIVTENGPLPWDNINSWDRFFVVLLIREYTFVQGEAKIEYEEDCINCDNPVKFVLDSQSLMFDMPDPEVMPYFNADTQTWNIDPEEFDVEGDPITLYLPTLAKEANIKAWAVDRLRNKKKVDQVFLRFLSWMAPKISKDQTIATRQIREYETRFKSWDVEMFTFMDSIIKNIIVTPSQKLTQICPTCGEEVTSDIRFQNGISSIFAMAGGRKKFGKK